MLNVYTSELQTVVNSLVGYGLSHRVSQLQIEHWYNRNVNWRLSQRHTSHSGYQISKAHFCYVKVN